MKHWEDKIVVVTGGSAGLGFAIARQFALEGAVPVLVARNLEKLKSARSRLAEENLPADYVIADVTDAEAARKMIDEVVERHGKLDVLVNNVGKSIRTKITETTPEQYRDLMEANFMSAVNCSLPALKSLESSSGHIINIGSLAAKSAWPFIGPYTTSKFALAGFNHQLRVETPPNIHVMFVCPGPIQRDDSGKRYDEQSESLPDEAKKPGAGVSFSGIDPAMLAKKIVKGCRKRKIEILVPRKTRWMLVLGTISPGLGDWLLTRLNRKKK